MYSMISFEISIVTRRKGCVTRRKGVASRRKGVRPVHWHRTLVHIWTNGVRGESPAAGIYYRYTGPRGQTGVKSSVGPGLSAGKDVIVER